jgi:serine/threonine protein kinase
VVLERLDGGTLTQMLGYDTRIRDRRRRFWKRKHMPYLGVLKCARSMAAAMQYCHEQAIPGSLVLHRDLKPDNVGFTLDGTVKIIDFGLARILENADPKSNEVYTMSGETGSLRYMSPGKSCLIRKLRLFCTILTQTGFLLPLLRGCRGTSLQPQNRCVFVWNHSMGIEFWKETLSWSQQGEIL